MAKYFWVEGVGKINVKDYDPKYEGMMLCIDENCRQPVRMLYCTNQPSYIKICPGCDHIPSCTAQNKTPSGRKGGQTKIGAVPIIYLNVSVDDEPQESTEEDGQATQRRNNQKRGRTKSKEAYMHLKHPRQVAGFVRENYHRKDEVLFRDSSTNRILRFDEVIHDCNEVARKPEVYEGKGIYVIGKINQIQQHMKNYHWSLYFAVEKGFLRLFLHSDKTPNSIDDLIDRLEQVQGKLQLAYGFLELYGSPQIHLRSLDELFIIHEKD